MLLEIRKYPEIELTDEIRHQVSLLLQKSFPETSFHGQHYYKQLPHYRLLAYEDEMLIGHLAVDYRMMRLNDQLIKVFGLRSFCVFEERRNHYIGSFLLEEAEKLAEAANADFLFVFSTIGGIFKKHDFKHVDNICTWLKIDEHKSTGIGDGFLKEEIMIKQISHKKWETGNVDFLGYLY